MARALYTIMVCVIVMLAVPVSQLRLVVTKVECCCPDQKNCHCPDHDKKAPTQTTIKSCHKQSSVFVSADAGDAAVPERVAVAEPARRIAVAEPFTSQPHESPSPDRPRGPS